MVLPLLGFATVSFVGPRRLTEADRDYVDGMRGGEAKPLHRSTRFGRGAASYSLRQMFELCLLVCALDFLQSMPRYSTMLLLPVSVC